MKIWSLKSLLFVASLGFMITSCTDDGGLTPVENGPTVSLEAGTGVISADATVNVGEEFTVIVKAAKTDNDMNTLTIEEGGVKIDATRMDIAANPLLLTNADKTSFTKTIKIKAHTTIGEKQYSFIVTDANGNKSTKSIKITTLGTPPKITLKSADAVTVGTSSLLSNGMLVEKGTSKLKTVEVLINDVAADKASLYYGDQILTAFAANPLTIPAADADKFDSKIIVRTPATAGNYKYTFKWTDETGLSTSQVVNVTVGTPVNMLEGVLLNQAGPSGTGGLDLDNGAGTGTSATDTAAEIRDMGINNANPAATNWKQQIAGFNGSVVKYIKKGSNGVPETFSFANVTNKEQIAALFAQGTAFTKTDGSLSVSDVVAKDDVFIVQRDAKYYLLLTKEVKVVNNANSDSYTFDIKF